MKKLTALLFSMFVACISVHAADRDSLRTFNAYPYMQKGSFHTGASFGHMEVNSSNSEAFLLLKGLDFSGHLTRINPFLSYAYKQDRAIGLSFKYLSADLSLDSGMLDVLNDGLQFSAENLHAMVRSSGFEAFHRWFHGLDELSRFALYYDTSLSCTNSHTEFYAEDPTSSFTDGLKLSFGFTPGIMMFVLDNVAVHIGLNVSTLSYNREDVYDHGELKGRRTNTKCQLKANPLGLVYGISIQL